MAIPGCMQLLLLMWQLIKQMQVLMKVCGSELLGPECQFTLFFGHFGEWQVKGGIGGGDDSVRRGRVA